MSQKIKIVVFIEGGVCQSVASDMHPDNLDVVVVDLDDAKDGGMSEEEALREATFADGISVSTAIDNGMQYVF